MGILDKIFGNTTKNLNSLENKIAIYLSLFTNLAMADGNAAEVELQFSREFLSVIPGVKDLSENQWERIFSKAESYGSDSLLEADNLTDDDKFELIDYLVQGAASDGHFDSNELSFIFVVSSVIGHDPVNVLKYIQENFEVDQTEIDKSLKKMAEITGEMQKKMKNS